MNNRTISEERKKRAELVVALVSQHLEAPYRSIEWLGDRHAALEAVGSDVERVRAENAELRQQRLMILASVYPEAPRLVAKICDEMLDRSGKLLGDVRELARLTPPHNGKD